MVDVAVEGRGRRSWWLRAAAVAVMTTSRLAARIRRSESDGSLLVLARGSSCRHSRQRGVASTYGVFDMPAIRPTS